MPSARREAVDDLGSHLVQERERRLVNESIQDLTPDLVPIDDAALVQQREMPRDVLLRSVERVGERLDAHLPFNFETLDHPDPHGLAEDRQAMSHLAEKDIGDRMWQRHD